MTLFSSFMLPLQTCHMRVKFMQIHQNGPLGKLFMRFLFMHSSISCIATYGDKNLCNQHLTRIINLMHNLSLYGVCVCVCVCVCMCEHAYVCMCVYIFNCCPCIHPYMMINFWKKGNSLEIKTWSLILLNVLYTMAD